MQKRLDIQHFIVGGWFHLRAKIVIICEIAWRIVVTVIHSEWEPGAAKNYDIGKQKESSMLPAVHLLIGFTVGIFLLYCTRDCRAPVYCAVGSLLPDLIDKPVGHIILANLGNGRIFFHSLTVCAIVAILGIFVWQKWRHPGFFFIAAGILSHQLADAMWNAPQSWYWPFLGGFPSKYNPYYFENIFGLEFTSPSELLVIFLSVFLFIGLFQAWRTGNRHLFHGVAAAAGILLFTAGVIVSTGLAASLLPGFLVYSGFQDILICGLSLLLGGVAFILVSVSQPVGCKLNDFLWSGTSGYLHRHLFQLLLLRRVPVTGHLWQKVAW